MSYIVLCPEGVAYRNTPNFEDRNQQTAGPSMGERLQGNVAEGAGGLYYLQTQKGYVPFYKQDGSVVLGPAEQVASYQVTAPNGIAYRKSANMNDRKPEAGPTAGSIAMGIKVVGADGVEYLQTAAGFLPITDASRQPLLAQMPAGTMPPSSAQAQQPPPSGGYQQQAAPPPPSGGYQQQPQQQQYGQPQQSQYGQPQQYGGAPPPGYAAPPPAPPGQNPGYAPNAVGYGAAPVAMAAATGVHYGQPQQQQYGQPQQSMGGGPPQGKAQQAQQAFQRFDTDRSGTIEIGEFMNAMAMLGNHMAPADAQCIFMCVDSDGDGRVTLQEFTQHWVLNH